MPTPFAGWTYRQAQAALRLVVARPVDGATGSATTLVTETTQQVVRTMGASSTLLATSDADRRDAARRFLEGDHWQDRRGWIGPQPAETDPDAEAAWSVIAMNFTSRNMIAEIAERHVDGVVGHEVAWSMVPIRAVPDGEPPTDEEQTAMREADAVLTTWWDRQSVPSRLALALRALTWAERQALRLMIPAGLAREALGPGGTLSVAPMPGESRIAAALRFLHLELPAPGQAGLWTDAGTQRRCAIHEALERTDDGDPLTADQAATREVYELAYVDDVTANTSAPVSRLRVVREDTAAPETTAPDGTALRIGGRLPMHEMTRPALITADLLQLQRALNMALTTFPRTIATAGWLKETLLNAQMPGHYETTTDTGGRPTAIKFVPDRIDVGPLRREYVQGMTTTGESGQTGYTSPSLSTRAPVVADAGPIRALLALMLERADQAHVLAQGDTGPSGISREQARADFVRSLHRSALVIEAAVRWLLETVLAEAEAIAGTPGLYTSRLRASVSCMLDTGPLGAEEIQTLITQVEKNQLTLEDALSRQGVADPVAAATAIRASESYRINRGKALLEYLALAPTALVARAGALALLNLPPKDVTAITTEDPEPLPGAEDDPNADPAPTDDTPEPDANA